MQRAAEVIIYIGGGALALLFFAAANAYSPHYTHPDLTEEMIEFYNTLAIRQKIEGRFIHALRQGSMNEDLSPRWINHFYDPQSGEGWTGEHLGPHEKEKVQAVSRLLVAMNFNPLPAPQWAVDQEAQNKFINYGWNRTWQKAIYDYVNGNAEKALETLGYILHLIEDMSVPDHTRNDSHPHVAGDPGSPYEEWAKTYTNSRKPDTANQLLVDGAPIPQFSNLREAFDYVAKYSNENFFSEETIHDPKYSSPRITNFVNKDNLTYALGITDGIQIILYQFPGQDETKGTLNDPRILSSYFDRLSRRAVLGGAGVIDLFFREVEGAKNDPSLLKPPPPPPNSAGTLGTLIFTRVISPLGELYKIAKPVTETVRNAKTFIKKQVERSKKGMFGVASVFYGTSVTLNDLDEKPASPSLASLNEAKLEQPEPSPSLASPDEAKLDTLPTPEPTEPAPQNEPLPSLASPNEVNLAPSATPELQPQLKPKPQSFPVGAGGGAGPDNDPPPPPYIITQPKEDNLAFTSTTITFKGRAERGNTITTNFSSANSAIDNDENWSMSLGPFNQGTTTVEFYTTDRAGNKSEPRSRTVFVDTLGPNTSLTISECNQSLASEGCLIATTTATLEWSTSANDLSHYELTCEVDGGPCAGFNFANTTATTTIYTALQDLKIHTFKIRAIDIYGNAGAETSKIVEVVTRPVIINEIAWAGTSATRSADEWIELYNPTDKTIDLSQMKLKSLTDNKPNINLSGTIPAKGYYLIERTDDNTISDITASTTESFGNNSGSGLVNSGEQLAIQYKGSNLDETPTVSACSGWCAGSDSSYKTMERVDPFSSGTDASNWSTWADFLGNGKNADNEAIKGTPGRRNSVNYLITSTGSLSSDKTLTSANSPYIIKGMFTVLSGATLTVNPGVTVKFLNSSAALQVNGRVSAVGTATNTIAFTSFNDDTYAGDTNATTTAPAAGDWAYIKVNAPGSRFENTVTRYGGATLTTSANLWVDGAEITLKNSIVEKSGAYGAWLKNTTGTVEGNTIRDNNKNSNVDSTGLYVEGGSPSITSNTISGNTFGLRVCCGATSTVSSNTFSQNTDEAVRVTSALPAFSGNTASGNGTNGIRFEGTISEDYTFSANLPHVIKNSTVTVASGKTLTLEAGTIVKLDGSGSIAASGKIITQGTASNRVIFTSLKDDEFGGDTNATTTVAAAGDWLDILFDSGASSSTLQYVTVRYGGGTTAFADSRDGTIRIKNSSIDIKNSIVEKNFHIGIWTQNSTSTVITNSFIRDHATTTETWYGLYLTSSSTPTVSGTMFTNNGQHIFTDATSTTTPGTVENTFD